MGGGGGGGKKKSKAFDVQAQLAEQLFRDTDPLRQSLIGRSQDFLAGGDVTDTPAFEFLKLRTDQGFNQAKDNTIARFAPGGALMEALTGLESDRATTLAGGAADIQDTELARALALGTGATELSLAALGQAGNTQAAIAQANAQEDAAKSEGAGTVIGSAVGAK